MIPEGEGGFWLLTGSIATLAVAIVSFLWWRSARGRSRRHVDERRAYLEGVRHLLSGDSDAAIEALTQVVRVNTEAVETYFALGGLFRRKGDIERAIRIHENILMRPGLPEATREDARFQLALDYRKAGMLSQAREALGRIVEAGGRHRERLALVLEHLRDVCLEAGDLDCAVDAQRRRMKLVESDERAILTHLLSDLARSRREAGDLEDARQAVKDALRLDPDSVDARLAGAELALARDDWKTARAHLEAAVDRQPESVVLAWPLLQHLFWDHDRYDELGDFLLQQVSHHPRVPYLRLMLARHLRRMGLVDRAVEELQVALEVDPSFHDGRQELGRILLEADMGDELRRQFQALLDAIAEQPAFRCTACGHPLPQIRWRCPRCGGWDTVTRTSESSAGQVALPAQSAPAAP